MSNYFLNNWPWNRFNDFISLKTDRFTVLKELMQESGLQYVIHIIDEKRHFFISPPPSESEYSHGHETILVAHYDRSPGSPGANDNGAAVFILIETAMKLIKDKISSWRIIFTDKEELSEGEGIQDQGAYSLAMDLRRTEMENARFYNFDACGIGDTLIISTTAEYFLEKEAGGEKLRASIKKLKENALEIARNLRMGKVCLAPTPFSDDLGFLRAGIAVQTIAMLPSEECSSLISVVRKESRFTEILVNQNLRNSVNIKKLIPLTWRNLNSPRDSYVMLTPQYYRTMMRFIEALCN